MHIFNQEIKIILLKLLGETHVIAAETILVQNESLKRYSILQFPHSQEILLNFYMQTLIEAYLKYC